MIGHTMLQESVLQRFGVQRHQFDWPRASLGRQPGEFSETDHGRTGQLDHYVDLTWPYGHGYILSYEDDSRWKIQGHLPKDSGRCFEDAHSRDYHETR